MVIDTQQRDQLRFLSMTMKRVCDHAADLRSLRADRGLSLAQLSELADVAVKTIWRIEHGDVPTRRIVRKLAAALCVEPACIVLPGDGLDGEAKCAAAHPPVGGGASDTDGQS
jgi:DNA-binding XRE family transcriptional regulator